MKFFAPALVLSLMLSASLSAQASIQGDWSGNLAADQVVHLALTVQDGALTGSVIVPGGVEFSIEDGIQAGTQVQFKTTDRSGETARVHLWVGTVNGNTITFSVAPEDGATPAQDVVVTRRS